MALPVSAEMADGPGLHEEEAAEMAVLSWPVRIAFLLGSIALLTAMATDTIAVAGRHLGMPLLGSIELVQVAVSVAGSTSILIATLVGAHASIHVLTDRVSPPTRRRLLVAATVLAAIFFAILSVGCGWIGWDLRQGHELTELLSLPLMPFRIFVTCCFAVVSATFIWRACQLVRA